MGGGGSFRDMLPLIYTYFTKLNLTSNAGGPYKKICIFLAILAKIRLKHSFSGIPSQLYLLGTALFSQILAKTGLFWHTGTLLSCSREPVSLPIWERERKAISRSSLYEAGSTLPFNLILGLALVPESLPAMQSSPYPAAPRGGTRPNRHIVST